MRLNLPWWLTPWAEARRLRGEAFSRALAHGSEVRGLRAEIETHKAVGHDAVRAMVEVQSYCAAELLDARLRAAAFHAEATALRERIVEIANLTPPPVYFVRKDDR